VRWPRAGAVLTHLNLVMNATVNVFDASGHNVFAGYLGRPDDTALAMVDGWFRSGDLGRRDEQGFITIMDRKKDL
jgi:acyl-CoA synthetase (AMP-forming)/AMP-acid ligase II